LLNPLRQRCHVAEATFRIRDSFLMFRCSIRIIKSVQLRGTLPYDKNRTVAARRLVRMV